MFIGGGEVFAEVLDMADRAYITYVHNYKNESLDGNAYFPVNRLNNDDWLTSYRKFWTADHRNPLSCSFVTMERADRCGRSDSSAPATTAS